MPHPTTLAITAAGLLAAAACSMTNSEPASASPQSQAMASSHVGEAPLVVELFTSQGCSSCPPADRLVGDLARAGQSDGRAVVPLTFHVDYWNDLGWADPYSLPAWTERQRQYATALGGDRVYTPELVVGGGAGMVGSQSGAVGRAIAGAPAQAPVTASATWAAGSVTVTATAPADADVVVAVWEGQTSTAVPRGENAGETLASAHVVRRLDRVAAAGQTGSVTVKVDPSWQDVGAVAFAQRRDMRITGATVLRP
jgi:hypothetical protein|nr:DUF1223 domain-containing protein [Kofleriaceae bacterium]